MTEWTQADSEVMRKLAARLAAHDPALEQRLRPLIHNLIDPQDFVEEFRLTVRYAIHQKPRYKRPTRQLLQDVTEWAALYGLDREAPHRAPIIRPSMTPGEAALIAAAADMLGMNPSEFLRMAAVGVSRRLVDASQR